MTRLYHPRREAMDPRDVILAALAASRPPACAVCGGHMDTPDPGRCGVYRCRDCNALQWERKPSA